MGKLPKQKNENRVLIICEGYEEYDYLNRLKECNVWSKNFSIELKNAKSIDKIAAIYKYAYQNGSYKLIVIVCDTETEPYAQFENLRKKLNDIHGKHTAADHVIFFVNPCTLQIVLSHMTKVNIKSNQKSDNSKLIEKYFGVMDYRATEEHRAAVMRKINAVNYISMKDNISGLESKYKVTPSTNINLLFDALESGDVNWFKKINNKLKNKQ